MGEISRTQAQRLRAHAVSDDPVGAGQSSPPNVVGRPRVLELTDARIADAVDALITTAGPDSISVTAVSEALEVSRATLYRNVSSRDQLLRIYFEERQRGLAEQARAIAAVDGTVLQRLTVLITQYISSGIEHRQVSAQFYTVAGLPSDKYRAYRREAEEVWFELTGEALAAGVLRGEDPLVVSQLLMGMCTSTAYWWGTAETSPEHLVKEIMAIFGGPAA